jgi:hypothetical protein
LSDHVEPRALQKTPDALTEQDVVVGEDDTHRALVHHSASRGSESETIPRLSTAWRAVRARLCTCLTRHSWARGTAQLQPLGTAPDADRWFDRGVATEGEPTADRAATRTTTRNWLTAFAPPARVSNTTATRGNRPRRRTPDTYSSTRGGQIRVPSPASETMRPERFGPVPPRAIMRETTGEQDVVRR